MQRGTGEQVTLLAPKALVPVPVPPGPPWPMPRPLDKPPPLQDGPISQASAAHMPGPMTGKLAAYDFGDQEDSWQLKDRPKTRLTVDHAKNRDLPLLGPCGLTLARLAEKVIKAQPLPPEDEHLGGQLNLNKAKRRAREFTR